MPILREARRNKYLVQTPEGGLGIYIINKTGANSVKGSIVESHDSIDDSVKLSAVNSVNPIGVVYSDGIPDGSKMLVIIAGIADVLLKNTISVEPNDWCGCSDVAGRAYAQISPPAAAEHDREVGHFVENKTGGTNVLAKAIIHFR